MLGMWAFRNWAAQGNRAGCVLHLLWRDVVNASWNDVERPSSILWSLENLKNVTAWKPWTSKSRTFIFYIIFYKQPSNHDVWFFPYPCWNPKSLVFRCFHSMFLHPIVDPSRWKKPWIQGIPGPCHSPARHWACSRRDQPAWRSTWDRWDRPIGGPTGIRKPSFWEASKWMARLRCAAIIARNVACYGILCWYEHW